MGNPEMLYEKLNFPNAGSSLGKEKKGRGRVKNLEERGICGDKNKSWVIFLPSHSLHGFSERNLLGRPGASSSRRGLQHPSAQGGLCKSSPSSRESGLIQYYRVEKGRKNPAETAALAEAALCKKPPPQNKGDEGSCNLGFGTVFGLYFDISLLVSPTHLNTHIYSKQQPGLDGNTPVHAPCSGN